MASAADRLYEIALDAIAQQRAEVERARGVVVPVSAAALAIAAALVKPAFNAPGTLHTVAATVGALGAFGVMVASVLILLEPKEPKQADEEGQAVEHEGGVGPERHAAGKRSRIPGLTLKFDAEALSKNPGLAEVLDDDQLSQIVLATYLSRVREKNEGRLRRLRHLCIALLLALVLEAVGFVAAAVFPIATPAHCHPGSRACPRSRRESGLQLTALRIGEGGVVQLRGRIDVHATGALALVVAFARGHEGRSSMTVPIVGGRFAARATPSRRQARTCEASYRISYAGSATFAPAALNGRSVVACRRILEDAR